MKIKKETVKVKPYTIKDYKRMARELYPIVPTKIHKNKKKYNRKKEKQQWMRDWEEGNY